MRIKFKFEIKLNFHMSSENYKANGYEYNMDFLINSYELHVCILLKVGAYINIFEFDTMWDYNWCVVLIKVAFMTRYVPTSVSCHLFFLSPSDCKIIHSVSHVTSYA